MWCASGIRRYAPVGTDLNGYENYVLYASAI